MSYCSTLNKKHKSKKLLRLIGIIALSFVILLQLGQGFLIKVSPSLVKRSKNHFHNMPFGASIILGNNGYVWISPTIDNTVDNTGGFIQNLQVCEN